jgi:hypothetical protein
MSDRTHELVVRQAQAMNTDIFEVGLYKPARPGAERRDEMLLRTWDLETLVGSIAWLRYQNADGRNIYIRPKGEHSLSLVDDLTADALERMRHSGFTPAIIVETSPENFQAWLNHGRTLPKRTSTAAARALAEKFGGDPGSADWRHFGRLNPFSNRKEKHRQPGGHYPFVRLIHSTGEVYEMSKEFLSGVEAGLEQARIEAERRRDWVRRHGDSQKNGAVKTIEEFRQDARFRGDGNRIDLAYAVYALSHGVSEDEVRRAIATRDLSKKGTTERQAEYLERTLRKASQAVHGEELAR